jgi:hypothetical protein
MKKVNRFNYMMPLNRDEGLWDSDADKIIKDNELVNKGLVGKGESLHASSVLTLY